MQTRCIITASPAFSDYSLLRSTANQIFEDKDTSDLVVISGCPHGKEEIGEVFASRNNLACIRFPFELKTYGRSAACVRNKKMAEFASLENGMLIAFWDGNDKGTRHMIHSAEKYGLEIHVVKVGRTVAQG